ncbi:MAG: hypothetical protein C4583_06260 [Anaerolineaceae bacterium]|nr:MAG: hypothetical protein C4583_06260 [Anaerolineaceae bacterium]
MKRRNPIITGLLNALIPGFGHVYVNNAWGRFVPIFLGSGVLIIAAYLLGNAIQNIRNSPFPAGLCPSVLILAVLVSLFIGGMKISNTRNDETDEAAFYRSKRTLLPQDSVVTKLQKLLKQRKEGLISSEQYDSQKADIESKK